MDTDQGKRSDGHPRRCGKRAGESLAGERQGDQPVDDGVHAPLAFRRAARTSLTRGTVVFVALKRIFQPLLLVSLHIDWPVELKYISGALPECNGN